MKRKTYKGYESGQYIKHINTDEVGILDYNSFSGFTVRILNTFELVYLGNNPEQSRRVLRNEWKTIQTF